MIFKSEIMNFNIKEAVGYLTFKELEKYDDFLNHAFSTRLGGVSEKEFKSMNFNLRSNDKKENVINNYHLFCNATGFDYKSLVLSNQTHSCNIKSVNKEHLGIGLIKDIPEDFSDVDGLITNIPNITLVTFYADCIPIFIVDKKLKVISLVHAGWKGTVNGIAKVAINKMIQEFKSNPRDILCCLGPGINQCCFEVDEDVYKEFKSFEEIDKNLILKKNNNKYNIDLLGVNKYNLISIGISEENIIISDICTSCCHDLMFSHRKTQGKRGTMVAMMSLK